MTVETESALRATTSRIHDINSLSLSDIDLSGDLLVTVDDSLRLPIGGTVVADSFAVESDSTEGYTISIEGLVTAANGTTFTGTIGDDLFTVTPQASSTFDISGGSNSTTNPGDQLILNDAAVGALIDENESDLEVPLGHINFVDTFQRIDFDGIETLEDGPSVIDDITVSGTGWNLSGVDGFYSLLGNPERTLPWNNINVIRITFSEDVLLSPDSIDLIGSTGEYAFLTDDPLDTSPPEFDGFRYDASTRTATLILADSIDVDRLRLVIHGESSDGSPVSNRSSGQLIGTDFQVAFSVNPGDFTGDGTVSVTDVVNINTRAESGQFGSQYDVFADVNRDGSISVTDVVISSINVSKTLPANLPIGNLTSSTIVGISESIELLDSKKHDSVANESGENLTFPLHD